MYMMINMMMMIMIMMIIMMIMMIKMNVHEHDYDYDFVVMIMMMIMMIHVHDGSYDDDRDDDCDDDDDDGDADDDDKDACAWKWLWLWLWFCCDDDDDKWWWMMCISTFHFWWTANKCNPSTIQAGSNVRVHSTFCFTVLAPCFVLHAYHCALHLQDICPYSSTHMFIVTLRPAVRLSTSKERAFRDGAEGLSWQGYARPQSSAWCFFGEAVFIIRIIEYRSC